jgi:hypothetical protein
MLIASPTAPNTAKKPRNQQTHAGSPANRFSTYNTATAVPPRTAFGQSERLDRRRFFASSRRCLSAGSVGRLPTLTRVLLALRATLRHMTWNWVRTLRVTSLLLALGSPAWACGAFELLDSELRHTFVFYIESVHIRGEAPESLFRIKGCPQQGMYLERDEKRIIDFAGAQVRVREKAVGTWDGATLRLLEGGTLTIRVTPNETASPQDFDYEVLKDGKPLFEGTGMSFLPCAEDATAPGMAEPRAQELRTRLALFLVWRQYFAKH